MPTDELDPELSHLQKGLQLANSGQLLDAIVELELAVASDPWDQMALRNLAVAFKKTGNNPAALKAYERLVVLNPLDADTLNSLGGIQIRIGDSKTALKTFTEALRLDPSAWRPRLNLAGVLLKEEKIEPAIMHIQKILAADPNNLDAKNLLATTTQLHRNKWFTRRINWARRHLSRNQPQEQEAAEAFPELADMGSQHIPTPQVRDPQLTYDYTSAGVQLALPLIEQEFLSGCRHMRSRRRGKKHALLRPRKQTKVCQLQI